MKILDSKAANYLKKKVKAAKPQSRVKRQLWTYMLGKKTDGLAARRFFERRWLLNLAFLAGRQYTYFHGGLHEVKSLAPVKGRIRVTDNQLMGRVRRQIADFIKNDPVMSVVPSTTEDEDIKSARAGDKFLKSFWQSNRMKKKIRQSAGWIFSCGNVFLDHRWDKRLGPIMRGEDGKMVYAGDVDVDVWSPFEVLFPTITMGEVNHHQFPWILKMKWRSLEWIVANYKEGYLVKEETMAGAFLSAGTMLTGVGGDTGRFPGALVIEFYEKPGNVFKQGASIVGANGIILEANNYPYNAYNLEQFKDIDIPGQFWGKATMEEAIPLQKTWNQTLSDIQEFNRLMGRGKWLVPDKSNMRVVFDNVTGQHVYYKPVMGHKPELMTMKSMPPSFMQILDLTALSLNNLFSQHEVSQGTNKSDIRSGDMVELLREQDAHGAIPSHQIFEESLENLMIGVLRRVQKGYTQPRMIEILGRDEEVEVTAFQGTDLRGNQNVLVKKQSSLPDSRMAREARIMNRFERGLYGDPRDSEVRRHVMTMLEDASVKDMYSSVKKDEKLAKWENRFLMSVDVPINVYDDHAIHLKEHTDELKSLDYQKMKLEQPKLFVEIQMRYMKHQLEHQKFLEEQRTKMLEEQSKIKGGGTGG